MPLRGRSPEARAPRFLIAYSLQDPVRSLAVDRELERIGAVKILEAVWALTGPSNTMDAYDRILETGVLTFKDSVAVFRWEEGVGLNTTTHPSRWP